MEYIQVWAISGLILIILEAVIPGGVVIFLGIAALIVAGLLKFGFISGISIALTSWFIISLALLLILRSFFMKFFEGDTSFQDPDEESEIKGAIVKVVEEITPFKEGRVLFRDTTWAARGQEKFQVEDKAIILGRDKNTLIITKET